MVSGDADPVRRIPRQLLHRNAVRPQLINQGEVRAADNLHLTDVDRLGEGDVLRGRHCDYGVRNLTIVNEVHRRRNLIGDGGHAIEQKLERGI